MTSPEESNWEQLKENYVPLRQGRAKQALAHLASVDPADATTRIGLEAKRRDYVKAVDEYQGDDPLEPWLKFIKWTQDHLTGGKAELQKLLHSCTTRLLSVERYRNDKRFLRVWIQYADCLPDPSDVFLFLKEKGIGLEHALYYEAYAAYLELKGNCPAAEAVYNDGISRQAKPVERLQQKYTAFQTRMAQRIQRRIQEEAATGVSTEDTAPRASLAPLVPRASLVGTTHLAPLAGPSTSRPAPGVTGVTGVARSNAAPSLLGMIRPSGMGTAAGGIGGALSSLAAAGAASGGRAVASSLLPPQHIPQQGSAGLGGVASRPTGSLSALAGIAAPGAAKPVQPLAIATDDEFSGEGSSGSTSVPGYATMPQGVSNLKTLGAYGVMRKENQEAAAPWVGATLPQAAPSQYAAAPAQRLDICVDDEFQDDSTPQQSTQSTGLSGGTHQAPTNPGSLTLSSLLQAKSGAASVPSVLASGLTGSQRLGVASGAGSGQGAPGGLVPGMTASALLGQRHALTAGAHGSSASAHASRPGGLLGPQSNLFTATQAGQKPAQPSGVALFGTATKPPGDAPQPAKPVAGSTMTAASDTKVDTQATARPQAPPQPITGAQSYQSSFHRDLQAATTSAAPASACRIGAHTLPDSYIPEPPTSRSTHAPSCPPGDELSIDEMRAHAWLARNPHASMSEDQADIDAHDMDVDMDVVQDETIIDFNSTAKKFQCIAVSQSHPERGPPPANTTQSESRRAFAPRDTGQDKAAKETAHQPSRKAFGARDDSLPGIQQQSTQPNITNVPTDQPVASRTPFAARSSDAQPQPPQAPPRHHPPHSTGMPPPKPRPQQLQQQYHSTDLTQDCFIAPDLEATACRPAPEPTITIATRSAFDALNDMFGGGQVAAVTAASGCSMGGDHGSSARSSVSPHATPEQLPFLQSTHTGRQHVHEQQVTSAASANLSNTGCHAQHMHEPTVTIATKAAFDALNDMFSDALPHEGTRQRRSHGNLVHEQQGDQDEQISKMPSLPAAMKRISAMDVLRLANSNKSNATVNLSMAARAAQQATQPTQQGGLAIHEDTEFIGGLQAAQQAGPAFGARSNRRRSSVAYPGLSPEGWHDEAQAHPSVHNQPRLDIYEDTVCVGNIPHSAATAVHNSNGGSRPAFGGDNNTRPGLGSSSCCVPSDVAGASGGLQLYEDTEFIAGPLVTCNKVNTIPNSFNRLTNPKPTALVNKASSASAAFGGRQLPARPSQCSTGQEN